MGEILLGDITNENEEKSYYLEDGIEKEIYSLKNKKNEYFFLT